MRPTYLADLDQATRAVLAADADERAAVAARIVAAADTADRFRKRLGKAHPAFGTGTLSSAVQNLPRANIPYCHADYRACLVIVLAAMSHQFA